MDLRSLGAIATGYFQGQLANRDRQKQLDDQAKQDALRQMLDARQVAETEYQRGRDAKADEWAEADRRVAGEDRVTAAADRKRALLWETGGVNEPGSKAYYEHGLAVAAALETSQKAMLAARGGKSSVSRFDPAKAKPMQGLPQFSVGQSEPWSETVPENVPYPGENGPETEAPYSSTQAAMQILASKRQAPVAAATLTQPELQPDMQIGQMSLDQLIAENAKRPTENLIYDNGQLRLLTPEEQADLEGKRATSAANRSQARYYDAQSDHLVTQDEIDLMKTPAEIDKLIADTKAVYDKADLARTKAISDAKTATEKAAAVKRKFDADQAYRADMMRMAQKKQSETERHNRETEDTSRLSANKNGGGSSGGSSGGSGGDGYHNNATSKAARASINIKFERFGEGVKASSAKSVTEAHALSKKIVDYATVLERKGVLTAEGAEHIRRGMKEKYTAIYDEWKRGQGGAKAGQWKAGGI